VLVPNSLLGLAHLASTLRAHPAHSRRPLPSWDIIGLFYSFYLFIFNHNKQMKKKRRRRKELNTGSTKTESDQEGVIIFMYT
jgi:hypothetical protein